MVFVCPECGLEISYSHLLRVEKLPSNFEDESLIRLTYRHPCNKDYISAAFPAEKRSLQRLFPNTETLLLPWPRVSHVHTGELVEATILEKTIEDVNQEKTMARAIWELEQTEGAWDALLFMRGPRQPEEEL